MKYAVISGKGGTGKTFVATNLASIMENPVYMDCDIEEPNGEIFLKTKIKELETAFSSVPSVDNSKCIGCKKCVEFCKFNAMALIIESVHIFENLCHSCEGCMLVCPQNAIKMENRAIGTIEYGIGKNLNTMTGKLNIGESTGMNIVKKMLDEVILEKDYVIDGPPGSGCEVVEVIRNSDYCVLVAEPTTFGFHNFKMVYEIVKLFDRKLGVIINKADKKNSQLEEFCIDNNLNILKKIEYSPEIAYSLSKGEVVSIENKKYHNIFNSIHKKINDEVYNEKNSSN